MKGKKSIYYSVAMCLSLTLITGTVGVLAQESSFNNGNRFLRWRRNNSLVFATLDDGSNPGTRVVLDDHNPDTLGKKWRYEDEMIKGINDLCLDVDANSDVIVDNCDSVSAKWNFDEFGRLVAAVDRGNGLMGLGCAQGMIEGDLIPVTLRDCVITTTQSFELEGTGVTSSFADLEIMSGVDSHSDDGDLPDNIVSEDNDDLIEEEDTQTGDNDLSDDLDIDLDDMEEIVNENILDVLASQGDNSLLIGALVQSGLSNVVANTNDITLFAPNDQAFSDVDQDVLEQLLDPANADILEEVLLFHVVPQALDADSVLSSTSLTTLLGQDLSVEPRASSLNGIGEPVFESLNLESENQGIVHVINTILIPDSVLAELGTVEDVEGGQSSIDEDSIEEDDVVEDVDVEDGAEGDEDNTSSLIIDEEAGDASSEEDQIEEDDSDTSGSTISSPDEFATTVNVLTSRDDLSILTDLVIQSGVELAGTSNISVFAPTDEAFASVDSEVLEFLISPENSELLEEVLLYHVVPEKLTASEVLAELSLPTLSGQELPVDSSLPNLNNITGFEFIEVDIETNNDGIVHVINSLLIPDGLIEGVNIEDVVDSQEEGGLEESMADTMPAPETVDIENEIEDVNSEEDDSNLLEDTTIDEELENTEEDITESSSSLTILEDSQDSLETELGIEAGAQSSTNSNGSTSTSESQSDMISNNTPPFEDFVPVVIDSKSENSQLSDSTTSSDIPDSQVTAGESVLNENTEIEEELDDSIDSVIRDLVEDNDLPGDELSVEVIPEDSGVVVDSGNTVINNTGSGLSATEQYELELLFPTDNVRVNGLQSFQAILQGFNPARYEAYWQVDDGQLNQMENTGNGKASFVDVNGWNWNEHGPYLITVSAFLDEQEVASESVNIFVP